MKNAGLILLRLLLIAGFICQPVSAVETKSTKILHGSINELQMLSSYAGITLDGDKLPATIKQVRLGTPASYYGMVANDKIIDATVQDSIFKLSIIRGDQKFTARLPLNAKAMNKMHASGEKSLVASKSLNGSGGTSYLAVRQLSTVSGVTFDQYFGMINESKEQYKRFQQECDKASLLKGKATSEPKFKDWRAMKDYDFIVMLDVSGSMKNFMPTEGCSQWSWCSSQISRFTQSLNNRFSKGVTLILFNHQYNVNKISSVSELQSLMRSQFPGGGTDISNPLQAAILQKINTGRPTMIVVLSDGKQQCNVSSQEVVLTSMKTLSGPNDLKITFLQIGEGELPLLLQDMDSGLVAKGAPFDIVNIRTFDQVRALGLEQSVINCLTEK